MSRTRIKCDHCGVPLVYCDCDEDRFPTQEEFSEWADEFEYMEDKRPSIDDYGGKLDDRYLNT